MLPIPECPPLKSQAPDLVSGGRRRAPAKSISWKWEPGLTEREVEKAVVFFGGYPVGELRYSQGERAWTAWAEFTVDGRYVDVRLLDKYPSMKMAGDVLFFALQRGVQAEGFAWPW